VAFGQVVVEGAGELGIQVGPVILGRKPGVPSAETMQ
jgi:hypothetical protein